MATGANKEEDERRMLRGISVHQSRRGYDRMSRGRSRGRPFSSAASEIDNRVTGVHVERWVPTLKTAVPDARLVDYPGAGHYVFLTKEADVLGDVRAFIAALGATVW